MTLNVRITGQMTFEVVRDKIASLLQAELTNQETLAIAAGASPVPYQIDVTTEKSVPWNIEQFPVVNVSFDNSDVNGASSPGNGSQQSINIYNVDCFVNVNTQVDGTTILSYGDEETAKEAHQVAGIIYRILMADNNMLLGFDRGIIGSRIITSIQPFTPAAGNEAVEQIFAVRLVLKVRHPEIMPQQTGVIIDDYNFIIRYNEDNIMEITV